MRVERFNSYVRDLLANSGHPDIVRAEFEQVPGEWEGLVDLRVDFADGTSIFLDDRLVVGSSHDKSDLSWEVPTTRQAREKEATSRCVSARRPVHAR